MSANELLVLLIVIFAAWFLLKLARLAIRLIFIVVSVLFLVGVLWFVFS